MLSQAAPACTHCLATQTPFVQASASLQQCTEAEQVWLVAAHTEAATHVPLVAPAGMAQDVPAQQSAFSVQVWPSSWQDVEVPEPSVQSAQTPVVVPGSMLQVPLQQSVPASHVPPVSLQNVPGAVPGRRQALIVRSPYGMHSSPVQQPSSLVQDAPKGVQEVAALPPPHFSFIPSLGSGAHAWPLQHWSLNWHAWAGSMQHLGSEPSYPVGQVELQWSLGQPPKQRGMLFESSLQTAFLPSQQFWEAFAPVAPQMFPGGLQDVPLSQSCLVWLHTMP